MKSACPGVDGCAIIKAMKRAYGFTIVELIVVIVVIAILAAIAIVGFAWVRDDAMDTKIRATADSVGKAVSTHFLKAGTPIENGFFHVGATSPKINVNEAVKPYLPADFLGGIKSKNVNVSTGVFKYWNCTNGGFAIFASLNNPSSDDLASYTAAINNCPAPAATVSPSGYTYNYAKMFN